MSLRPDMRLALAPARPPRRTPIPDPARRAQPPDPARAPALSRALALLLTLAFALGVPGRAQAAEPQAEALRARHEALAERLSDSAFGEPLLIESRADEGQLSGEVFAVIEHPFAELVEALREPAAWCDILILHTNVKQCRAEGGELALQLGRRQGDDLAEAHDMRFAFEPAGRSAEHLLVRLKAEEGPLGTEDYRVQFAAAALSGKRSFIHLRYAYRYGMAARLATQTYLNTLGRNKVGFSNDASGTPIGGLRGLIERNTMRYYLAVIAFLEAREAPPGQRLERRLRGWFAATERYPRQLKEEEMDAAEYVEMKRREVRRQRAGAGPG